MTGATSPFSPLSQKAFRSIWIASLASSLGGIIQSVGAAWLMTSIATSVDMVALVQASTSLPIMIFSLMSGAIADNFDRRRVMLTAQLFMFVVSALLTLFAYFGMITPWLLLTFTFLIGCGTALNNPSWQAAVGDMVPRAEISSAVLLNSIGFNLTRSVGPAIGGVIVAALGPAVSFAVNTVSYVAPMIAIARWKPDVKPPSLPRESFRSAVPAGLRYVAMSPNIEKVLVRSFVFGFTAISILALLPLIVRDLLQGGPLVYGFMLGAYGVGAIGGALISGPIREKLSTEWVVRCAFLGFTICACVAATSTTPLLTGPALLIGGASWVMALSLFNVTVQLSTPRWVVGRALAIYQTATFGGMAIGAWVWGLLADAYGTDASLLISSVVMMFGAVIGVWLTLPTQTLLNLDPLNRWKEPDVALDIQPRSGPILITIEYKIRQEDTNAFLDIMAERRRMRRRDGARQWTLSRDLANPQSWIESYHTATWVEYVRHNQRVTHADSVHLDRLRQLHSGDEPPRVRRMIERPTNWAELAAAPKPTIDIH